MPVPTGRDARLSAFEAEPTQVETHVPPPTAPQPTALSVSSLVAAVNSTLQKFDDVWVRGEISSFSVPASGHWYFEIKDDGALLKVVMWRSAAARVQFEPAIGMEVLVRGAVGVYKDRSQLQLQARELRSVSAKGDLALKFEQLKARLHAEGLFDANRKRELPPFPRRIGIVTSLGAAALRDMVQVATGRNPGVKLLVANARVQGDGAAAEIAAAIARLNETDCDIIVIGRGGGSVEDLWAFNEEIVVRAVAASRAPVVSAVGHATDFTLADFAADRRAETPSNAMELVVLDASDLLTTIADREARMVGILQRLVPDLHQKLDELATRAENAMRGALARERELLARAGGHLDALSPLATLARGFSVVKKGGKVLRRAKDAPPGSEITVRLAEGALDAKVTTTKEDDA